MFFNSKIILILLLFSTFAGCSEEDVDGKIVIEYIGDWQGPVNIDRNEMTIEGNGNWEAEYINPDNLQATVRKLDSSQDKLTLYIYEDERIVSGASTRNPEGSVSVEYEFPF